MSEKILSAFLDSSGRLTKYPARRKKKLYALAYLASTLPSGMSCTERELNELLNSRHTFGDPATLRRELCDYRFLTRNRDGSAYTKTEPAPDPDELLKLHGG